ncbi:hypothetical protein X772_36820 [Mesorhizobium sp. LSJC280B00]|nr:hypothetical protein X772_36820 [Mesorhizobium sp. LSJC280B00]
MEAGIKERGQKLGIDAFMVGPTSADPALQVRAIEDLIAQGVKVIGVVPNDAKVLEPVLQKAKDAGIIVITHESPGQKGANWDFEFASAKGFGEAHAHTSREDAPKLSADTCNPVLPNSRLSTGSSWPMVKSPESVRSLGGLSPMDQIHDALAHAGIGSVID